MPDQNVAQNASPKSGQPMPDQNLAQNSLPKVVSPCLTKIWPKIPLSKSGQPLPDQNVVLPSQKPSSLSDPNMATESRFTSPNLVVAHAWPHKHRLRLGAAAHSPPPPPPPSSLSSNDIDEAAKAALRAAGSKLKRLNSEWLL